MPKRGEYATECKNGHDLTALNARKPVAPGRRGLGDCRQCSVERVRKVRGSSKTGPVSRYKGDETARLAALKEGLKRCPECGETKDRSEFTRNAQSSDGLSVYCRACRTAMKRAAYLANRDEMRLRKRAQQFGITVDRLKELIKDQDNGCAICGRQCSTGKALALDHDHETGAFRGLLCASCNRALGYLQDSPGVVRAALAYLEKWKSHAATDESVLGPGMS